MIPFLDLKAANAPMQADIDRAVLRVANSGRYVLGPEVEAFEAEWASYCGVKHCVGVGNGLDALQLILMAMGIGPGDEVIVPSNTYIATWLAVTHAGAVPVPVEPDPATYNIDAGRISAAITPRTAAIIAVHLYGSLANGLLIGAIAQRHGLAVIDDAAQSHGAIHKELSHAAAFSFYPTKNLGALGDAGAVITDDAALAERVQRLRHYGRLHSTRDQDHLVRGRNSRLDEIQAAVLRAKLPYLDRLNAARVSRAGIYFDRLADAPIALPLRTHTTNWHQFVIRTAERDVVQNKLADRDIETHVHYPVPPHLELAYSGLRYRRGDFPIAEQLARTVLSLPIGYEVEVERVAAAVAEVCWDTVQTELAHA